MWESAPLCRYIKHRSYKPTGHDRAEDNGNESAVEAEDCYTVRIRKPFRNTTSPVPTLWIIKNHCLQNREIGPPGKQRNDTHNSDGVHDKDKAKVFDTLTSE